MYLPVPEIEPTSSGSDGSVFMFVYVCQFFISCVGT